jgi:hypothetical protein
MRLPRKIPRRPSRTVPAGAFRRGWRGARVWAWVFTSTCLMLIIGIIATCRSIWVWRGEQRVVAAGAGMLYVTWYAPPPGTYFNFAALYSAPSGSRWPFTWWFHYRETGIQRTLVIPLWSFLAIPAIPTALAWRSALRCLPGHCPNCNYDLSGLPAPTDPATPLRCPECGHAADLLQE